MAQSRGAWQQVNVQRLEEIEKEAERLAAQVREMAAANRALGAANDTLTDANTALRRDTAGAKADTAEAQATTRRTLARNDALRATNEAMEARNAALEATADNVDEINADLAAHRVALQQLAAVVEAERAQLAVLLASVEEAVLVVDRAGTPLRINAAYARLFGAMDSSVPMEDVRGEPLLPEQTPRARAARGETFSLSFSVTAQARSIAGEDTRRWFVATGQPLHEGNATHGLVVIRDVTLADQHRRLLDEFLVLAAHELRTPLTSMQGYLELLAPLLRPDSDERARLYATRALHQTRQLVRLVRDLTDAARLYNGKSSLILIPLDLVSLAAEVVETARSLPPGPDIRFTTEMGAFWIQGDAGRLEQVLSNLITNAQTHAQSERGVDVRLRRAGSGVALEVQDYGRGIAADQLPHLFERFYQVASVERPSRGGLGLGLFLCQELIAAHAGRIDVVSREGEGTIFTVVLPLAEAASFARGPSDDPPGGATPPASLP